MIELLQDIVREARRSNCDSMYVLAEDVAQGVVFVRKLTSWAAGERVLFVCSSDDKRMYRVPFQNLDDTKLPFDLRDELALVQPNRSAVVAFDVPCNGPEDGQIHFAVLLDIEGSKQFSSESLAVFDS